MKSRPIAIVLLMPMLAWLARGGADATPLGLSTLAASPAVPVACGLDGRLAARAATLEPGDWMSFDLEPAALSSGFRGILYARNFMVVGDVEELELEAGADASPRSFRRRETVVRDGVTLSVFDLSFPREEYASLLPLLPIRFDCHDPACEGDTAFPYRMRPSKSPRAEVVRISDQVQYSSHVVNIVAPYETSFQLLPQGDRLFSPSEVAAIFYQHFEDSYEELALIPSRAHSSPASGAAFDRIYIEVEGIAVEAQDRRQAWGGPRELRHVNTYFRGDGYWNYLSLHETGHHWGFQFDLFDVAGVRPQRSTECQGRTSFGQMHQPLLADQPSFLSHCLFPPLCIERQGGRWRLAEASTPVFFHPLQAYAMGLLAADEVPPIYLRRRQDRPAVLRPGGAAKGQFVEITIDDIVARYGPRVGPAMPPVWRRATIVVSPERLLDRADLAWYNFLARRSADPDLTGIEGVDRVPSLEVATAGAVDLRTDIHPLVGSPIRARFEVSHPKLGRLDLPGVQLAKKLPTRFRIGRVYKIAGRVPEPNSFQTISLRLGESVFRAELAADGRFALEVVADEADRGPRWLTLGLGDFDEPLGRVAPVYVE